MIDKRKILGHIGAIREKEETRRRKIIIKSIGAIAAVVRAASSNGRKGL